ncbi:MAG: methyltransferase [Myxococcota bacterium]
MSPGRGVSTASGARAPWDRALDAAHALRIRILSSPRFQRWAARFPLTRFVARRRARALFDLAAGFVYAQVLRACVDLEVLETLAQGPRTPEDLGASVGLRGPAAARLLRAAASLGLVEARRGGRFGIGIHGASYLGNPAVKAMVAHHALLYADLAEPTLLLRGDARPTALEGFWRYEDTASPHAQAYTELMGRSLTLIAEDVLEAAPLGDVTSLLDVGGGEGVFVEALAERMPGLSLGLFDLPPVAERARERLAARGLDRVAVTGGDLFHDALPGPVDAVSLVRVLHDHDDEAAAGVLRAAHDALRPGGRLLLAEPMAHARHGSRVGGAYFEFYLLAMGQGRPRTPEENRALLAAAGFRRIRQISTRRPLFAELLVAERGPR